MTVSVGDGVSLTLVQPSIYRGAVTPTSTNVRIGDLWEDTSVSPPVLRQCSIIDPVTWVPVGSGGSSGGGVPVGGTTGQVLTKVSSTDYDTAWTTLIETGPSFTYTSGNVSRIDYDSGNYKLFTYTSGILTQLDYIIDAITIRKIFNYNPDGSLASIDQTVI